MQGYDRLPARGISCSDILSPMKPISSWDGPECIEEGVYRYQKCISWIRLFIDVEEAGFYGGTSAASTNFEVEREGGQWKRFETDIATTPKGEPVLRLRAYTTWDVVYERISDGLPIEEKIETVEDLAAYLERCFP
jgi:predicted RNA-binding Zn-ribbon protein involved in translation (DUF1610 family)